MCILHNSQPIIPDQLFPCRWTWLPTRLISLQQRGHKSQAKVWTQNKNLVTAGYVKAGRRNTSWYVSLKNFWVSRSLLSTSIWVLKTLNQWWCSDRSWKKRPRIKVSFIWRILRFKRAKMNFPILSHRCPCEQRKIATAILSQQSLKPTRCLSIRVLSSTGWCLQVQKASSTTSRCKIRKISKKKPL